MTLYDELKKDHQEVRELLDRIETASPRALATKRRLFEELKSTMTAHSRAEEKVLYDALKTEKSTRNDALEAYEEHHIVDLLMREIARLAPDDEKWAAKLAVLRETIEHHIREEEGEVFTKAREILDRARAQQLGAAFLAEKEKHLAKAG